MVFIDILIGDHIIVYIGLLISKLIVKKNRKEIDRIKICKLSFY